MATPTPSITPRPERRNRIGRQSISQPPPFAAHSNGQGENGHHPREVGQRNEEEANANANRMRRGKTMENDEEGGGRGRGGDEEESRRTMMELCPSNLLPAEEEGGEGGGGQQMPPKAAKPNTTAFYHQICVQPGDGPAAANGFSWGARSSHRTAAEEAENAIFLGGGANANGRIPLFHKVQILYGLEVLVKRLLFHLVKTSATSPKFFIFLPLALFSLTLLLCSTAWPPGPLRRFLFPFDSLQFNGASSGGGCSLAHLSRRPSAADPFPDDNAAFDAFHWNSPNEFGILLTTGDATDSVLWPNGTAVAFAELFGQIQDITVQQHKQLYKWWDLCRQCRMDPVVEHLLKANLDWHFPEAAILNQTTTTAAAEGPKQKRIFLAGTIGQVDLSPSSSSASSSASMVQRAHSLLMRIKLKAQLRPPLVDAFERRLRRIVANFTNFHSMENSARPILTHFWSAQRLSDEMEQALRGIHGKMAISWLLIAAILIASQCRASTYKSRPLLGVHQAIVLLLSSICAYSVHLASAGHFNGLLFALPYTLSSIGILLFASVDAAYGRYAGISMHPTEKTAFLFIWDGPCVVFGLLWLILLSLFSALFVVNSIFLLQFFLALSAGLICLLAFTISFLLICWLSSARRIASGLKWFHICRSGDRAFNDKQIFDYDATTCARLHEKLADLRPCFARRFGQFLCGPNVRMFSFGLFCVASIGAAVGWAMVAANKGHFGGGEEGGRLNSLGPNQFVEPQAKSRAFLDGFHEAFPKYEDYLELDFDGPIDYLERKEQIFALLNWPLEAELASRSVSWLIEFDKFQKNVAYQVDQDTTLPLLTHVFLQNEQFRRFSTDLRISQGQIHRSRMYLELTAKGKEQSDFLVRSLLDRANRLGLPLTLEVPFSFSIHHDIQILSNILSSAFWLSALSALLSGFQPALACCLFASNLFLLAAVHGLCLLFAIPLNIVTLGTLLAFGLPLNSMVLHVFAHHFFNAGPRQQNNHLRIQYAFQCSLWPILLASLCGPISLSAQFLFGPCPPIVMAVWKVVSLCSVLIVAQIVIFLPSLLALCSDAFHDIFTFASQLCDENASAEMTVDPMAENVYFVPTYPRQMPNHPEGACWPMGLPYGSNVIYQLDSAGSRFCVPPAYQPPAIEFPRKSPAQYAIQHSRQQSQLSSHSHGNSPRLGTGGNLNGNSAGPAGRNVPIYSPPNRRRGEVCGEGSKTDSGSNSFTESLESRAELRIHRRKGQMAPTNTAPFPAQNLRQQQQQPQIVGGGGPASNFRNGKAGNSRFGRIAPPGDEQIYEEPDTTSEMSQREEPPTNHLAFLHRKPMATAASPSYKRKYQI